MRGSWAILLAAVGDVREVPFHLAYILFSIIAALAMWSLARRFCERPFAATLLFLAVPAFVVNGNSFEADLPFLAFWMASIALFVKAVDRKSALALAGSAIAGALAGLAAYQAVLLTPILFVYLFRQRRNWYPAWVVILAAPLAIAVWQLWEWSTRGALPAAVLLGYMGRFETKTNVLRSGAALVVHSAWIVSPLLVIAAFWPKQRWRLLLAAACDVGGRDIRREPAVLALDRMRRSGSHLVDKRSPAPRLPGSLGCHLLRRGAADLLRRVCPLPVADRRTGRHSGRARRALDTLAGGRIRVANDIVVGSGDRQLSALGRLSPVRKNTGSPRCRTSRLGRRRMGPALLPGIGRRAASFAGSNATARRYRRIQRAVSCRHRERARRASERGRYHSQCSAAFDLAQPPFGLFERRRRSAAFRNLDAGPRIVCAPIPWSTANPC